MIFAVFPHCDIGTRQRRLLIITDRRRTSSSPRENISQVSRPPTNASPATWSSGTAELLALILRTSKAHWCRESSVLADSRAQMAAHPRVQALIMEQVEKVNLEFAQYQRVKKIALLSEEFTIERGELTPTLKARRSVIESRYKHLIDELYHEPQPA
jgi:hypothetical protein